MRNFILLYSILLRAKAHWKKPMKLRSSWALWPLSQLSATQLPITLNFPKAGRQSFSFSWLFFPKRHNAMRNVTTKYRSKDRRVLQVVIPGSLTETLLIVTSSSPLLCYSSSFYFIIQPNIVFLQFQHLSHKGV